MTRLWTARVQGGVALLLFLGSVATLLYNTLMGGAWPQRERLMQAKLEEASHRMAESADPMIAAARQNHSLDDRSFHHTLARVTNAVLSHYPDIEGGFYLADSDRFSGYGFPTSQTHHLPPPGRTDPPPLEISLIRGLAQQSLSEMQSLVTVRQVGPSRVMVATEAVGGERPAQAATWTMVRLTGPEQLGGQLRRYQISVALALGGFALALLLMLNMSRSMARQRASEEQLREELRRAEHLASLGRLVAGLAHEIRNPLAGIRSTIQLWQRRPDPARTGDAMKTVLHETERMNAILTRLLQLARSDRAERQANDMNALIGETVRLLEAQAAAQGVDITVESAPGLPKVWGSSAALRQVLLNLTTNALQAMPQGGRLSYRSRQGTSQATIEIDVTDTGSGVAPEHRSHLFEPFFTTRPDGTGLGLALCREIISQHGGQVLLRTDAEPGTTFTMILPAMGG
ncbi:MAG: ATP-binding protein [Nitrospira sp.]